MASQNKDYGITWTDETWNPIVGCSKISAGCANCYASIMAMRNRKNYAPYMEAHDGNDWSGKTVPVPNLLLKPLNWKRNRKVFVCSMADLFHETTEFNYISAVFGVIAIAKNHTFQVLTKRPWIMESWFHWINGDGALTDGSVGLDCVDYLMQFVDCLPITALFAQQDFPFPNVQLGTTVENQSELNSRVAHLLNCPAEYRFLSCEPLLGLLDFGEYLKYIDCVIVGGETGQRARPMELGWARKIRDDCENAGVKFHFKKWGKHIPHGQEQYSLDGVVYHD